MSFDEILVLSLVLVRHHMLTRNLCVSKEFIVAWSIVLHLTLVDILEAFWIFDLHGESSTLGSR